MKTGKQIKKNSLIASRLWVVSLLIIICGCVHDGGAGVSSVGMDGIKADFLNPPAETRPGCYWYWINDNVSKAGITKDLEGMARVGIGRAYIGHIFNHRNETDTPIGDVQFMTDAWWEAVQWAVKEAGRCGIEIGFFNSGGWSQSGGPWINAAQSMRYLASSETIIKGGQHIDQVIPIPEIKTYPKIGPWWTDPNPEKFTEKDFQDVKVIAFKHPDAADHGSMKMVDFKSAQIKNFRALLDGKADTFVTLPVNKDIVIDAVLPEEMMEAGVQTLVLKPLEENYTLRCRIEVSDDGTAYRQIADYSEQRGHLGPKVKDDLLIPFPLTKAKHFRMKLNFEPQRRTRGVRISDISLSSRGVLGGYVRKQLGEACPGGQPAWDSYVWGQQAEPSGNSVVNSGEVIDLSDKVDGEGRLIWDVPEGLWVVLRMGMVPIGTQNHPSSPESRGLEVDKMSKEHIRSHFNGMVGEFLDRTPAEDRKALKYVIIDSYETGPQNWTDGLAEDFEARFGYSPERFMPVFTGRVVDRTEVSDRFLWDMRQLIVERIAYDYAGGLREVCNENNLMLWLENYGHMGFPSEFLLYGSQTDEIAGEFWVKEVLSNVECRAASSCGRTYGKNTIYAESFTSGHNFKKGPGQLKKWCDWLYGTGVNHHILHVNIHQPDERKPGIIQWFGTSFNRHNTWFEQSKGLIDYTRRSSVLLKAGRPVIDVAYYIGENAPMMSGPRDPALPDGYDFDYVNSDVLINRARVVDGRIVVKDGASYAVLVLPKQTVMRPEVARAIKRLVGQGATIIGPKPLRSPSLQNYPACDETVAGIGREVWSGVDGKRLKSGKYGKGFVFDGVGLEAVLGGLGVEQDVNVMSDGKVLCAAAGAGKIGVESQGGIVFQHRTVDGSEVYFLANTTTQPIDFTASLRVSGLKPSLWDSVTGEIGDAPAFRQKDGRTLLPLRLEGSESIFVVFDGKISADEKGAAASNEPEYTSLATLKGPWTVHFDGQGAPDQIVFNELSDWSQHTNENIKYYSGTAVYKKSFDLTKPAEDRRAVLELGEVGVVATVFVNGKEAGIVWTTPWEIDVTDLLIDGKNDLEIRVANTWNNRLIADSKLPKEKKQVYVSRPYRFEANDPLSKGGLWGPVVLKQAK